MTVLSKCIKPWSHRPAQLTNDDRFLLFVWGSDMRELGNFPMRSADLWWFRCFDDQFLSVFLFSPVEVWVNCPNFSSNSIELSLLTFLKFFFHLEVSSSSFSVLAERASLKQCFFSKRDYFYLALFFSSLWCLNWFPFWIERVILLLSPFLLSVQLRYRGLSAFCSSSDEDFKTIWILRYLPWTYGAFSIGASEVDYLPAYMLCGPVYFFR